eukprot:gene22118-30352_t
MSHAGPWGTEEDSKSPIGPTFGLTGKNDQFSGTSAKNVSYAFGVKQFSKTLPFNERTAASLQPRRNLPYTAVGRCSLQNTTAENSSSNSKPVRIIPGQSLSTNQQPPPKVTNSNSIERNIISSGVINRQKPSSFRPNPLQLEAKNNKPPIFPSERKRSILPSKEKLPKGKASDNKRAIDSDEEYVEITKTTNTNKKRFLIPESKSMPAKVPADKPKQAEQSRHNPVYVRDIFMNQKEVFDKKDCELSIRFDGATRAVCLVRCVQEPKGNCYIERISFDAIREIVVFSKCSEAIPNFLQINVSKALNYKPNEILDLCDENVDPLITRCLVTMSPESLRSAMDIMKQHPILKVEIRSTTNIDEIVECLDPFLQREEMNIDVLMSQLELEMPRAASTSRPNPLRASRRRTGGIGLLTQQSDPDDHLTYMTYPIEFGAQDVITISRGDLKRFADREYFNDNLIDLKVKYMLFKLPLEKRRRVYAFSCLFYPKLKELRDFRKAHELISRWTKSVDIFSMDFIFVPINYSLHWSLCVVVRPILWLLKEYCGDDIALQEECMESVKDLDKDNEGDNEGCLLFLDSLNMHEMKTIRRDVTNYLSYEWKSKHLKRIAQSNAVSSSSTSTGTGTGTAAPIDTPSTIAGSLSSAQRKAIDDILVNKIDLKGEDNIFESIPATLLEVFPTSSKTDIANNMRSQLQGKWFTQKDITQERKTYRQLLADIAVEWKQSRDKLKEEGVLTEDAISQGNPEIVSPESQERMKQLQLEALGHDQEVDNVEVEENVYSSHHNPITGRHAVLDERESYLKGNFGTVSEVEYNDRSIYPEVGDDEYMREDSRQLREPEATLDDADPSSICAVDNTDWAGEETQVDSYTFDPLLEVEKADLFSENESPCHDFDD